MKWSVMKPKIPAREKGEREDFTLNSTELSLVLSIL
jgi:hypothetical protein